MGTVEEYISPVWLSSDLFTPDVIRITQPSIGVQQTQVWNKDDTLGANYYDYGGIGKDQISVSKCIQPVRTHYHLKTGVDEIESGPLHEKYLRKLIKENDGFIAHPIHEAGDDVTFAILNYNVKKSLPKVKQQVFPRSVVYELEYIKEQARLKYLAAMEREREAFKQKLENEKKKPPPKPQKEEGGLEGWEPEPPFWYDTRQAQERPKGPVGNLDDYGVDNLMHPPVEGSWLEEMQISNEEQYLPGEIYKNKVPKEPVKDLSKNEGCSKVWKPRDPDFFKPFDRSQIKPQSLLYQEVVEKRKQTPSADRKKEGEYSEGEVESQVREESEAPRSQDMCSAAVCTQCKCEVYTKKGDVCQCPHWKAKKGEFRIPEKKPPEYAKFEDDPEPEEAKRPEYIFGLTDIKGDKCEEWALEQKFSSWGDEREELFLLVGLPFYTKAARWAECNIPPTNVAMEVKGSKKRQ